MNTTAAGLPEAGGDRGGPQPMRVLTTAEPFGFGPVSKLRAVARALRHRGWTPDFVGSGSAFEYASGERDTFARVDELAGPEALATLDPAPYGLAVSVMDPFLAVWARQHGVPCVYVDSLFWFWGWSDEDELDAAWARTMERGHSLREVLAAVAGLSMPAAEYIGHRAAGISCVQKTLSTERTALELRHLGAVVPTDAIIDLSNSQECVRDGWVASLSGLLNPLIDKDLATRWAAASLALIDAAFDAAGLGKETVRLTGNRAILNALGEVPERFQLAAGSASEVLQLFNSAKACLTPPGLTTMLESLGHGCPVIPLPPQHYGHERILAEFAGSAPGAFTQCANAALLGVVPSGDAKADTIALIEALERAVRSGDAACDHMVTALSDALESATRDADTLAASQRAAVAPFSGNFDGVSQVAEVIEDFMSSSGWPA